ncbi:hypothetical protein F5Y19DRAFT_398514 [Xylariaceae sp. FL1651]|nr:hypothetical protein F5Y19DRAFT_398514 [Xylariaceae sp. FL1651]
MMLPTSLLVLGASIVGLSLGQTVQDNWLSPLKNDIWYTGQTYTISWTGDLHQAFSYYCPACDTSNVDLWITGTSSNFYLIKSGVNVETDKSIDWTVPITFDAGIWVFRFIPAGTKWQSGGEEISSYSFYTRVIPTTTSSSITSSTTTLMTSTTTLITSTTTLMTSTTTSMTSTTTSMAVSTMNSVTTTSPTSPTATTSHPATTSQTHSGNLSTGAKAGIGIGAAVGAIVVFALGFFLAKSQQRNKAAEKGGAHSQALSQQHLSQYPRYGQPAGCADQLSSWGGGHSPQSLPWSQQGSDYGNSYQKPEPAEMGNHEPRMAELPAKK